MATKGNEPAYPNEYGLMEDLEGNVVNSSYVGLTKREQLAAMAMQGLLANSDGAMDENGRKVFSPSSISRIACLHADALIEALNK